MDTFEQTDADVKAFLSDPLMLLISVVSEVQVVPQCPLASALCLRTCKGGLYSSGECGPPSFFLLAPGSHFMQLHAGLCSCTG